MPAAVSPCATIRLVTVEFSAVVLAGGRAQRLGGVDKLALSVGGRSLLERTLDAVAPAREIVVVGHYRETSAEVVWTREDPPGGGPLAGLWAGLSRLSMSDGLVAVLAADHPHVTGATVSRLLCAVGDGDAPGAVLADPADRAQWLVGVWRVDVLRRAMPAEVQDQPVRRVFAELAPVRVPAVDAEASDVDTPDDLRGARDRL